MLDDNLLTLGVFVLVFACVVSAIMVARGDSDTRRLEGRMRSIHDSAATPGGGVVKQQPRDIRRTTSASPLARILEKIGRSPHIPQDKRVAWPIVLVAGLGAAAGGSYIGGKIVSAAAAPLLGVAAGAFLVRAIFRWEQGRYQNQLFKQLPDAMGLILRAIRAGLPIAEALASVARELSTPSREEFSQVVNNIAIGQTVDTALFGLAERSGLTEYYFFAVTVGLQMQTGGNLAETLENLADMVRKRVALTGKVKAMTAEARVSAMILTGLPFVVGAAISVLVPGHLDPMVNTDLGFRLLLIGGSLLGIGLMAIQWLLKSAAKD